MQHRYLKHELFEHAYRVVLDVQGLDLGLMLPQQALETQYFMIKREKSLKNYAIHHIT